MPNETGNPNAQEAQRPQTRGLGSRSIRICPNRRRPRESLVLVLVIGNGAVEGEDEKEDDDDWVAAPLRRAVTQSCTLPDVGKGMIKPRGRGLNFLRFFHGLMFP